MATRTITVNLQANASGMVSGFRTARNAAQGFASSASQFAEDNRQSMEAVGTAGMVAGGVLVAGFGKAVSTFASFDKAMSSVKAATHESAANMELLSEAAITAGADTAYSAEEAAGAIEELAKAGVSTKDILNGGLNGALSLAAAGALDVGEAAETAASAMTQFGLKGKDIPHIADLLAAGAGKAQGSVHDLGMALNQAGLVANSTGLTIEETTGGLAAFASAGLTGSDAGTSFKSMLQRLNPQSEAAATLMSDLGLSAYDSQGEFIGLSEYAGKLQESLSSMSSEQRNATMQTLFGADAVRAANVLYEQGAAGVEKWEEAVNEAGYAMETARLMQDNLSGDLEKLGGAFDTVFLKAGGTGNDGLRVLVQSAEDAADAIGRIPAPVLGAIGVVGGLTGGALLLGGAFFTLAPRVFETVGHMRALSATAPGAVSGLGKIGKAAGLAGVAFVALQIAAELAGTGIDDIGTSEEFETAIRSLVKDSEAGGKAIETFASATGSSLTEIQGLGHALETVDLNGFLKGLDWVGSVGGVFDTELGLAQEALGNLDDSLMGLASGGSLEAAAEGFRYAAAEGEKVGKSVDKTAESFPNYMNALQGLADAAQVEVSQQELLNWAMGETPPAMLAAAAASEETAAALGDVGAEAEATVVPLEDIIEALFLLGAISMSSRDSTAAFHQALREMNDATVAAGEGTLGLGAVLNELGTDFDLTTEAGAAANAAFQAVASAGMADVETKAREGMGQSELQANLKGTYDSLITAADGMHIVGDDAINLARDILGVPDNVDIESWMSDAAKKMAESTGAAINDIPAYKRVDVDYVNTTTNRVINMGDEGHIAEGAGGRGGISRAMGGPVFGAGTATSDSIPAWLSNGEHVFTAKEVQSFGGHTALSAFRAQLDMGVPASFAAGGQVGREYAAPAAMSHGSSGGGGTTIEMPITINGATDVNAVRQAIMGDITYMFQRNGVRLGK